MHEEKVRLEKNDRSILDENTSLTKGLTEEEFAVYDRQIRLWGVESQKRLRKSRVLICGINCLGNEVSKNVILAGVDHMTILDATVLSKDDAEIQFLPSSNSFGKNKADAVYKRLHEMNPMVDLVVDKDDVSNKPETFYEKFDIVCLLGYPRELQIKVNEICHRNNIKFLSASNFGYYGYMFSDLGKHCYVEEKVKIDTVAKRKSKLGEPPAKQQKLDSSESQNTHDMIEQVCL